MKLKKNISKVFIFLLLIQLVFAQNLPQYSAYVNDYANIIEDGKEVEITNLISNIEKDTGVEIAVVTIKSLEGESVENYAVQLFEKWGIGKEKDDNGLLIVVSEEDRAFRMEVGYGLEGILNDAKVGRIARDNLIDYFKAGNYGDGLSNFLVEVDKIIRSGDSANEVSEIVPINIGAMFYVYIFLGFIWYIILYKIKEKKMKKKIKIGSSLVILLLAALFSFVLFIILIVATLIFLHHVFFISKYGKYGGGFIGGLPGNYGGYRGGGFGGFGGGSSGGGGFSGKF